MGSLHAYGRAEAMAQAELEARVDAVMTTREADMRRAASTQDELLQAAKAALDADMHLDGCSGRCRFGGECFMIRANLRAAIARVEGVK